MPVASVSMALGALMVVKVYKGAWAATSVLSRTHRASTANNRERRMGGPLSVHGGRVSIHRSRGASLSDWTDKVQHNQYLWRPHPVRPDPNLPPPAPSRELRWRSSS